MAGTADHSTYNGYKIDRVDEGRAEKNGSSLTYEKSYLLQSDATLDEDNVYKKVKNWVYNFGLNHIDGASLSRISIESEKDTENSIWRIDLQYTRTMDSSEVELPEQQLGYLTETFSTEGGNAHITQGYSETSYPCVVGTVLPNFNYNIGWNGNGFDGVDVTRPTFSFTLQKRFAYESINHTAKMNFCRLTGSLNNRIFKGFDIGSVLFMGVSANYVTERANTTVLINNVLYWKTNAYFDCSFKFNVSPNVAAFPVAGITIPKGGWEYVWALNATEDDQDSGMTFKKTIGVYKNSVYPYGDFDLLDLD